MEGDAVSTPATVDEARHVLDADGLAPSGVARRSISSAGSPAPYDTFISYAHAVDRELARSLERALRTFGRRWYGLRGIRTYRDETNLAAEPSFWPTIEEAIRRSNTLILLASPESARSEWVAKEVETAVTTHGLNGLCIVQTGGTLPWTGKAASDSTAAAGDLAISDGVRQLFSAAGAQPLVVDLRQFRTLPERERQKDQSYLASVASIAAKVLGRDKEQVWGEHRIAGRRRAQFLGIASLVLVGLVIALGNAIRLQRQADGLARVRDAQAKASDAQAKASNTQAVANQALASARQARRHLEEGNTLSAITEALSVLPADRDEPMQPFMAQAEAALYRAVRAHPGELTLRRGKAPIDVATTNADATRLITQSDDGLVLWDTLTGRELAAFEAKGLTILHAGFRPTPYVLTASAEGLITIWDFEHRQALRRVDAGARVIGATLSPDERTLVVQSEQGARLWDIERGLPLADLGTRSVAAFSADGHWLVTATKTTPFQYDEISDVTVWSAADGSLSRRLAGKVSAIEALEFSPNGRYVLARSQATVHVWSTETGSQVAVLQEQPLPVVYEDNQLVSSRLFGLLHAAFSPDSRRIVTTSEHGVVSLWSVPSGRRLRTLTGHRASVIHASFSGDGRVLITAGEDRTARVWDVESGSIRTILPEAASAVAHDWRLRNLGGDSWSRFMDSVFTGFLSADGRRAVTTHADGTARVWSFDNRSSLVPLLGHKAEVTSLAFSPDGHLLASASQDFSVRLWMADGGAALHVLSGHRGEVTSIRFSPDGRTIVSGSLDGTARIWDAASGKLLRTLECGGRVRDVAFVTRGLDSVTRYYNGRGRVMWVPFAGLADTTTEFGGRVLTDWGSDLQIVTTQEGTVSIWSAGNGALLEHILGIRPKELGDESYLIHDVAFSADGASLVTIEAEPGGLRLRDPRLWETANGQERSVLSGHAEAVVGAVFSSAGHLATVSGSSVHLWDASTGKSHGVLNDTRELTHVVFSPDGRRLATASIEGALRVWDIAAGEWIDVLSDGARPVSALAFDSNGQRLAIARPRGDVTLWRLLPAEHALIELARRRTDP